MFLFTLTGTPLDLIALVCFSAFWLGVADRPQGRAAVAGLEVPSLSRRRSICPSILVSIPRRTDGVFRPMRNTFRF
jgi:hypothetical protein